jgi:hypothetical protein
MNVSWCIPRVNTSGDVVVSDGGGASGAPRFYYWRATDVESPPTATAELSDDGTPIPSAFTLPDLIPNNGKEVRCQRVTVDARVYEPLDGENAGLTCFVKAILRNQNTEPAQSQNAHWTIPASSVTENGLPMRWVFKLGDQGFGGGFRISFENVKGVAIDRVIAEFTEQERRP